MKDFLYDYQKQLINEKLSPVVRLQKIKLRGFKNIRSGELVFNNYKEESGYGVLDVMGIYGQNGSGKTSIIDAIYIMKRMLSGHGVSGDYSEYISRDKDPETGEPYDHAELEFLLEIRYNNGLIRRAKYALCLKRSIEENIQEDDYNQVKKKKTLIRCIPYNECISISELGEEGVKSKLLPIIDAGDPKYEPFGPGRKIKELYDKNDKDYRILCYNKIETERTGRSFIFNPATLNVFATKASMYFEVLQELQDWVNNHCYIIKDPRVETKAQLLYTGSGPIKIGVNGPVMIEDDVYPYLNIHVELVSKMLNKFIPGVGVKLIQKEATTNEHGESCHFVELRSSRDDFDFSLMAESAGIRALIGELFLIFKVIADKRALVAIDEFDAGVFELLLGQVMEYITEDSNTENKGQFIFTSHNLRVLETVNKKYLSFTTNDPDDKYYKLKGIGASNNLRNIYLRLLGDTRIVSTKDVAKKVKEVQDKELINQNAVKDFGDIVKEYYEALAKLEG